MQVQYEVGVSAVQRRHLYIMIFLFSHITILLFCIRYPI